MILLDIKNYIKKHQKVSLAFICTHFDVTQEAAEGILEVLTAQGHVVKLNGSNSSCPSNQCSTSCQSNQVAYQWIAKKLKPLPKNVSIQIKQA